MEDQGLEHGTSEKQQRVDYFPASKLFEYQWPLGTESAEFFILQEHVKEYLDIRGIQRKYPGMFFQSEDVVHLLVYVSSLDLYRRTLEIDERKYLMGRGVVTEMQSNMGNEIAEMLLVMIPILYNNNIYYIIL